MTKDQIEREIEKGNFRYSKNYQFKDGTKVLKVDYKNANKNFFIEDNNLIEYFKEKYPHQEFIILGEEKTKAPEKMNKDELMEHAREKGILITEELTKKELLELIRTHDENIALEGINPSGVDIETIEKPEVKIEEMEAKEIKKDGE